MSDLPDPVSAADLIAFGFGERTSAEAAQEIAELVHAIFGPFEQEAAEGWALSKAEDFAPADLRASLVAAAEAPDPLTFLGDIPDAQTLLVNRMRLRWSARRARALGHPASLDGQTWSSLSEPAQGEVREALRELATYANTRVLAHRPERGDLDTFLSELAEIYVRHLQQGDRTLRATRPLRHRTDVPHSPTSRFIRLADLILSRLSLPLADDLRLHPGWRSVRGLSDRWKRRKEEDVHGRRPKRTATRKNGSSA